MSFINTLSEETLSTLIKASGTLWFVSKPDGVFLDASPEFCRWSGFTHEQLLRRNSNDLTNNRSTLDEDLKASEALNQYSPYYVIRKQLIPNHDRPQWGELYVTRHPASGDDIEFFWSWWVPAKGDAELALDMVIKDADKRLQIIDKLRVQVENMAAINEEEKLLLSGMRMVKKHPKVAAAFLAVALSIAGLNQVLDVLQKFGFAPVPMRLEIKDSTGATIDPSADQVEYMRQHYVTR